MSHSFCTDPPKPKTPPLTVQPHPRVWTPALHHERINDTAAILSSQALDLPMPSMLVPYRQFEYPSKTVNRVLFNDSSPKMPRSRVYSTRKCHVDFVSSEFMRRFQDVYCEKGILIVRRRIELKRTAHDRAGQLREQSSRRARFTNPPLMAIPDGLPG